MNGKDTTQEPPTIESLQQQIHDLNNKIEDLKEKIYCDLDEGNRLDAIEDEAGRIEDKVNENENAIEKLWEKID